MSAVTYEKVITPLLVVDPHNDFISEGGKIWGRIQAVAEASSCVPHMLEVLTAARKTRLRIFYATAWATGGLGNTSRRFRSERRREKSSNTFRGEARSVPSSHLSRATLSPWSIGVPAASPIRIWICYSTGMASKGSSRLDSSHILASKRPSVMPLNWVTR